jgi:protease-4
MNNETGSLQTASDENHLVQVINMLAADARDREKAARRDAWIKTGLIATFILVAGFAYYSVLGSMWGASAVKTDGPTLALVSVQGAISATSDTGSASKIVASIKAAAKDDNVQKIILHIDSPGGAPVEAERIMDAVKAEREVNKKPVVAVISNVGASAGYMIALSADSIVSGKYSLVGSIGAVLQAWNGSAALEKLNITAKTYASGDLKAMLNPFEPGTEAGSKKAQELVDQLGGQFADLLAERRKDKLSMPVTSYTRGEIWNGEQAVKLGLVDKNGTFETVAAETPELKVVDFSPSQKRGLSDLIKTSVADGLRVVLEQQAITLR